MQNPDRQLIYEMKTCTSLVFFIGGKKNTHTKDECSDRTADCNWDCKVLQVYCIKLSNNFWVALLLLLLLLKHYYEFVIRR